MSDANELVKILKQSAAEAVEAAKPVNVCYGSVISTSPLQIQLDQKLTLGRSQLVLAQSLTSRDVSVTVDWTDEDGTAISGTKTITLSAGLSAGDTVLLLRKQGGQEYIVFDRIG